MLVLAEKSNPHYCLKKKNFFRAGELKKGRENNKEISSLIRSSIDFGELQPQHRPYQNIWKICISSQFYAVRPYSIKALPIRKSDLLSRRLMRRFVKL